MKILSKMNDRQKNPKAFKTNCYVCSVELDATTLRKSPREGDTRHYCGEHWRKAFGAKPKLTKRL